MAKNRDFGSNAAADKDDLRVPAPAARETKFEHIEVSLTLDGQTYVSLQRHDVIDAQVNSRTVKFLRREKETFYDTLRLKLKWGERPED